MAAQLLAAAACADAQDVKAVTCIPVVVSGGSGASTTCTVTLTAPAATGGAAVALKSSLPALAASAAKVTVAAGQSSAAFKVWTNPAYRRYGGLAFVATISASRAATTSTTIDVTAQPKPAPIGSGAQIGQRFQWQGAMCGSISPFFGGDASVLYQRSPASKTANGTCTFKQECSIACNRNVPNGVVFNDSCAATGVNPVSLAHAVAVGGDRVEGTLMSPTPATASSVTATASGTVAATYLGVTDLVPVSMSPKPNTVTLSVDTSGKAGNSVASAPAGISVAVGNGQSAPFAPGTSITLSVSGGRDAIFSGACATGGQKAKSCRFTITSDSGVAVAVQ